MRAISQSRRHTNDENEEGCCSPSCSGARSVGTSWDEGCSTDQHTSRISHRQNRPALREERLSVEAERAHSQRGRRVLFVLVRPDPLRRSLLGEEVELERLQLKERKVVKESQPRRFQGRAMLESRSHTRT